MKTILFWSLICGLLFTACRADIPEYEVAALQGKWRRISSSDVRSDSMLLEVQNDSAFVLYAPPSSNFSDGDVKWKRMVPIAVDGNFELSDLSARGEFWGATIVVLEESGGVIQGFELSSNNYPDAPGGQQFWEREE